MQNMENMLERAKTDESAFREIYDITIDRVFSYTLLRVRSKDDAKEIVQEIYLSFWKSLPKFRYISDEHFYGFLWQVVRRRIIKYRSVKRETVSIEDIYDVPEDVSEKEDYRHLLKYVTNLTEKERSVVELRYFENYAFKEVADALGVTESNAKVLHHRAIANLKKNLNHHV